MISGSLSEQAGVKVDDGSEQELFAQAAGSRPTEGC